MASRRSRWSVVLLVVGVFGLVLDVVRVGIVGVFGLVLDVGFADLVADQMTILYQGRFADLGTPGEIRASSNPDVRRFLAGELREE